MVHIRRSSGYSCFMDGEPLTQTLEIGGQAESVGDSPNLRDIRVRMVGLIGFCVFLDVYATQTLLPLFTRVFSATKFQVSLTVSATTVAIAIAAPFYGVLAERFGRRQTMVAAASLLTLPVMLAATAPTLSALIGWRFVQGLIMPGIIAVTLAYISEEWAGGGAAAVMAAYVAGNVLGGVTGRFLSGVVADHLGWRASFIALGCLNAAGATAVWRWLPASRLHVHGVRFAAAFREMAGHLRQPMVISTFAVGFASLFGLVATFTYITFYLAAPPFRLGTTALGSLFMVYLVGVIVTPVCGNWIEHFGHRASLAVAAIVAAVGVALTLWPSLATVLAGLALCSSGVFVCQAAAASYLGEVAGKARSSAAGIYATFYYIGGTAGAAAPAFAWKLGGWPACVMLIVGMLLIDASIALICWKSTARKRRDPNPAGFSDTRQAARR
jgi:YNFM family putative membrane transporter